MKNSSPGVNNNNMVSDSNNHSLRRETFGNLLQSDDIVSEDRHLSNTSDQASPVNHQQHPPPQPSPQTGSPYTYTPSDLSPTSFSRTSLDLSPSPLSKSPWSSLAAGPPPEPAYSSASSLLGSLVRQEGHIYSLAASGDLLYTGSESRNIRVWKNQKEYSGFRSNSGLVKAIIIVAGECIFSGHQDGKIRIWKASRKDPRLHKRVGTLPTLRAKIKSSLNPSNYVEVRKNRNAIWIKHTDAISCLALSEDKSLLYSASWDKTFKVWRVSDSKCLESIAAHDDAVNAIAAGFDGMVFTGSADGSVKVWQRKFEGKGNTKHALSQTLLKQECAITSLAVSPRAKVLYCGSSDGLVNFWEGDKFLFHGGVLRGHKLAVLCLAAMGDLVFSGSADTNICVWRREGGSHVCLTVLIGHGGPVKCLAVEEEEKGGAYRRGGGDTHYIVYSGSIDKSVKIWRVSAAGQSTPAAVPLQQVDNAWPDFSFVQTPELLHAR